MRYHRRHALGASLLLALALVAAACGGSSGGGGASPSGSSPAIERGTIVVGVSGAFAENQLVAEMYAQVLEDAGYTVERQLDLDSRDTGNAALASGDIDVKPEYLAFELPDLDPDADTAGTAENVFPRVQAAAEANDLTALEFSPANSTNVFVVTPDTANELGVATMSDLAPVAGDLVLGAPPDCDTNFPCEEGLKEVYGIEFKEIKKLDFGGPQTVAAIDSGAVDVGELFSLDPTITAKGYVVLEDDKVLQPAGNFFALARTEILNGEVEDLLNGVTTSLQTDEMVDLVGRVQVDHEDVADVAREYLESKGLLG
ncbi:MAG TPA: ABC transporter substrate-binding protein [Actinomycetota bacterium]|nr:ABC transporter substrate-binding protein [Actinomycetota bacterium]